MHAKARLVSFALAILMALLPSIALAETYAHGYLRYEVADQSVTITGYEGREETVTVPAMIGGNPVNTIASGAFADATTVRAVYLPDTVISVEQGAFGVGQAVVFGWRTENAGAPEDNGFESPDNESVDFIGGDSSDGNGNDTEAHDASGQGTAGSPSNETDGNGNTTVQDGDATEPSQGSSSDDASQAPSSSGNELGIRTGDGSLVTVDDEGNLVLVNKGGAERVLDDSRSYEHMTRSDGTVSIVNDVGDEVVVADGSKVSFSDVEGRQVVVDAARNTTTVSVEDGSFSYEVAEVGDDAENSTAQAHAAGTEQQAVEQQNAGSALVLPIITMAAIAIVIVVGIVYWKRRKR